MNVEKTVFAQLLSFIPRYQFDKCVTRYRGNYRVKTFTCWEQFIVMCFAQWTYRDSLRDIETCLHAMPTKLYHIGLRSKIARSTIADANESRDWHIFADFCHYLIRAEKLYHDDDNFKLELKNAVYAGIARRLICVSHYFHGPSSGKTKELSSFIPSLI